MQARQGKAIFQEKGNWMRASDLKAQGLSYYHINELLAQGEIERMNRGIYRWKRAPYDEKVEVARLIPNGVFCLFTACAHYELSTFIPAELHVAIPKKAKYKLPEYPPIRLYYWNEVSWATGMVELAWAGSKIRMYDMEKTVCDMLRLRNKTGNDLAKEVVWNYLRRKDKNLVKLMNYARLLRTEKLLNNYLQALL